MDYPERGKCDNDCLGCASFYDDVCSVVEDLAPPSKVDWKYKDQEFEGEYERQ